MDYRLCCDLRNDGGLLPIPHDTVPLQPTEPLRGPGLRASRMKHGPPKRSDIPADTVPNFAAHQTKKALFTKSDGPWTTAPGKFFSTPPYMPTGGDGSGDGTGRAKASHAGGAIGNAEGTNTGGAALHAHPMKMGKHSPPMAAYPHMADCAVVDKGTLRGPTLRTGRGPALFDSNIHAAGGQMVPEPPATGADKAAWLAKRPQPIAKMHTNTRKKDTFGDYPAHMSDPYKDNPLADDRGRYGRERIGLYAGVPKTKPSMPIVNVWDAGVQTKAGVRLGQDMSTGETAHYLTEVGRLGTTD